MSRKSRGKKPKVDAVPEEVDVLAEGSGPVEGVVVHVGIDTIAADQPEPTPVDELIVAAADVLEEPAPEDPPSDAAVEADSGTLEEISDEEAVELGAVLPTSAASMDAHQLKFLVEALVFASDKPMTLLRLRQLTRVSDVRRLEQALAELAEDYKERGIVLQQVSGGYQFRTRTQFSTWVQQLIAGRPVRLSRAQLETLAIIAYRQPITRPEIDEIRGVDSSATLKLLLDRSLIRILGKKEEVGRPMLYGTTKEFLDFFSLGDLRELPTLREYSELTDESRQVMSDELGIDPDDDGSSDAIDGDEIDEPKPESIEDMVASYTASMDESATTGVFEAEPTDPTGVFEARADAVEAEPEADDFKAAATASLESLARRRVDSHDESESVSSESESESEPEPEPEPVSELAADDSDADGADDADDAAAEPDALVAADATVPDLDDTANPKHDSSTTD